ncbi:SdiA-regulated domain-containing protein [Roseivirga sp.]|uniref:SdiA-regulated domain-containing protein n=1 Tax=Roseivirga sp. TaxID=1964215 RepID=UPI002B26D9B4|nr:SdiA-regulated domain-containing protein [Roseivirga sp.]
MKRTPFLFIVVCLFTLPYSVWAQDKASFPYNLESPSESYRLPSILEEISALSYYGPSQLATLNDEQGRVYIYDLNEKEIVQRIRFEGNGDFEGLELVGKNMYAIKSNGKLYKFNIDIEGVVESIDTPFNSENDVEGLGYDKNSNNLLIALKGKGDIDHVKVKGKAVYGYNLTTEKFSKTPLFILQDKDLERVLGSNSSKFRPSAIAVHPISGEIYMIASVGSALVVFNNDGSPKNLSILKRSLFPQPEGIAFMPNGDLFISNEGDDGGIIHRFNMKQN